ncbi:hypothetical protein [Lysobacter gummosus]
MGCHARERLGVQAAAFIEGQQVVWSPRCKIPRSRSARRYRNRTGR